MIRTYTKGAYKILEAVYNDLTGGQSVSIDNNAEYVYAMEDLRERYGSDEQFYDAVYRDIIIRLEPIAWNVPDVEDPFHFLRTDFGALDAMKREGYVFAKPMDRDENCQDFYELAKTGDPDYNPSLEYQEAYRWAGKDYPTKTMGAFGMDTFYDCLNYYRSKMEGARYDPYEFYNMFSAIKRAWMNNWKQKVAMYGLNVFTTYVSSLYNYKETKMVNGETVYEKNTRCVKLLTEFNALYRAGQGATQLTIDNWFLPENIKEFAPWAYIRINEVIKQMRFKNAMFTGDNFTYFRGKYYTYEYGANDLATIFLRKPFLLMKSYANAEVYNEKDLETVDVNYVDFLTNNTDPTLFHTNGRWYTEKSVEYNEDGAVIDYSWNQYQDFAPQDVRTFVGVVYDKKAMATTTYDEHIRDTGLNERTEHGVLHLHGKLANYVNFLVKGVVIVLE